MCEEDGTVQLSNGSMVCPRVVLGTLEALKALLEDDDLAAFELSEFARDSDRQMEDKIRDVIVGYGFFFCNHESKLDPQVRQVILCAFRGKGWDMTMYNPLVDPASVPVSVLP